MKHRGYALIVLLLGWLVAFGGTASAHELRPSYLQVTEIGSETYDILWKVPARGDLRLSLDPQFDGGVKIVGDPVEAFAWGAHVSRWKIECPDGIAGTRVTIGGLEKTFTDALIRVAYADGTEFVSRLQPDNPSVMIEAAPGWGAIAWTYLVLGIEHILLGIDHLLFVLALLLIVDRHWMLVKTMTAFTVGHSITLALSTFAIIQVPADPLNAAIALSILFLGPEIVRKWRGGTSLTLRHPWLIAGGFGLLHGIGFASGLSVTGIPRSEIPLALLWFNLGVEVGQLTFVAVALMAAVAIRTLALDRPALVPRIPGYAVGILGAFWTIQRVAMMIKP